MTRNFSALTAVVMAQSTSPKGSAHFPVLMGINVEGPSGAALTMLQRYDTFGPDLRRGLVQRSNRVNGSAHRSRV